MNLKNILLLVTVCHLQLTWGQDDDGGGGSADDLGDGGNQVDQKGGDKKGGDFDANGAVINYADLNLNKDMLKGSRWAVEQKKNRTIIEVFHAIDVVDITKVDVATMSIRVEIYLRQRWDADENMKLPTGLFKDYDSNDTFIRADPKILESLWSPDSFIPTARESKISKLTTEQAVVNIFKNKTIVYKARLYTILGCAFSFQWYPLDKQSCELSIQSYTLTDDMVRYRWEDSQTPVHFADLKLFQYSLIMPLKYENGSAGRWGRSETYPYVYLRFEFERELGHHLIQVFIPTILVVILSWFSFWLGMDAIPGRISLLITCMLTMVTMHSGMKGSLPPVNYIKMMDIWMVGCMVILFLALCEFVVVKYLHWRKQQKIKAAADMEKEMKEFMEKMQTKIIRKEGNSNNGKTNNIDAIESFNPYLEFYYKNMNNDTDKDTYPMTFLQQRRQNQRIRPAWEGPDYDFNRPLHAEYFNPMQQIKNNAFLNDWEEYPPNMRPPKKTPIWVIIDRVSRVLFPLTFLIFNAIYWPVLIIGADNQ